MCRCVRHRPCTAHWGASILGVFCALHGGKTIPGKVSKLQELEFEVTAEQCFLAAPGPALLCEGRDSGDSLLCLQRQWRLDKFSTAAAAGESIRTTPPRALDVCLSTSLVLQEAMGRAPWLGLELLFSAQNLSKPLKENYCKPGPSQHPLSVIAAPSSLRLDV